MMENQQQARKAATVGVFSRAAETYDRVGPRYFSYFGQRLVELSPLVTGAKVLDLATGGGAVLFPAVDKVGPAGQVLGIDLVEEMVARTSAEIATRQLPNASAQVMDAEQLDLGEGSFEAVLCGFGLFFFPQLAKALTEIYRVLKPGGFLAATSWGIPDERWNWMSEVGMRPQSGGSGRPPSHATNNQWLETGLEQAGFINYRVIQEEKEFIFADEDEWWATEWSHGARGCLERLEPETLERVKSAAYQRLAQFKQPNGIPHLYRAFYSFARKPQ